MGQIFNRFKFFVKSHLRDEGEYSFSSFETKYDPDSELKKIIDELSSSQSNSFDKDFQQMSIERAYQVLGIGGNPSIEQIKQAYKNRLKQYHPDLVANLGEELQILAKKKTQEINSAYQFLKKYHNF